MARPVTPLGSLGAKVAATLEDTAHERDRAIEEARKQFLTRAIHRPGSTRRIGRGIAIAMAAALSAAAIVWFSFLRHVGPLQFNVDGATGVAQTWLAAPTARPLVLTFSDGTVLHVEPSSRARVVDIDEHGASISLESGLLRADVVHTSHSAWRLIAGPFTIRVTGTRFEVRWDAASQKFSIAVREGSVGVSGSIVGTERPVRAGEKLVASVVQGRLDLLNGETLAFDEPPPGDHRGEVPLAGDGGPPAESSPTEVPLSAPSEQPTASPEASAKDVAPGAWRDFAKSGDLRQAFSAAEARGFQGVCDSATSSELLLLGDAARLSGRSDRATEALLALRRRYPRDPRRAAAAFALGKVAFDQRHAYGQAAEWFATCVREQPDGPLAREASGRQIEALRNAGDAAGAQRAARAYLARYPDGPHADVARSVLR
jgi:TolA-binding protein